MRPHFARALAAEMRIAAPLLVKETRQRVLCDRGRASGQLMTLVALIISDNR